MVINWTNPAIEDLHNFHKITKKLNPEEYIINLVKNTNLLIDNPNLGKAYFYYNGILVRQLIYKEHRVLYYINETTIHIIALIHYKQDIKGKIEFIKKYFK